MPAGKLLQFLSANSHKAASPFCYFLDLGGFPVLRSPPVLTEGEPFEEVGNGACICWEPVLEILPM